MFTLLNESREPVNFLSTVDIVRNGKVRVLVQNNTNERITVPKNHCVGPIEVLTEEDNLLPTQQDTEGMVSGGRSIGEQADLKESILSPGERHWMSILVFLLRVNLT